MEFLKYVELKDRILASQLEQLCLQQKSFKNFCFIVSEKNTYLCEKLKEPSQIRSLETLLRKFLREKDKLYIEIQFGKIQGLSLGEKKKQKEKKEMLQVVEQDPFLKKVKNQLQVDIKDVKIEKN